MKQAKSLGEFEILILAALIRLGDQAYGVAIRDEIESRSGRPVSIGALYPTLSRLEKKAYVTSSIGEPTAVRGGRAKRYYALTAHGVKQLEKSSHILFKMLHGLPGWPTGTTS
ncbi:MAG: helix-turn-helix transcriptional regulator [Pseudomonadota bacterium]